MATVAQRTPRARKSPRPVAEPPQDEIEAIRAKCRALASKHESQTDWFGVALDTLTQDARDPLGSLLDSIAAELGVLRHALENEDAVSEDLGAAVHAIQGRAKLAWLVHARAKEDAREQDKGR